jgi:hypothetical protein
MDARATRGRMGTQDAVGRATPGNWYAEGAPGSQGTRRTPGTLRRLRALAAVVALVASLGAAVRPAAAAEKYVNDFGVGLGTVVVDLFYMPVKVVYATLGGITGGFAFLLTGGRLDIARAVWTPSMGGTYVVTPSMLRGEDPIYFSGVAGGDRGDDPDDRSDERPHDRSVPHEGY